MLVDERRRATLVDESRRATPEPTPSPTETNPRNTTATPNRAEERPTLSREPVRSAFPEPSGNVRVHLPRFESSSEDEDMMTGALNNFRDGSTIGFHARLGFVVVAATRHVAASVRLASLHGSATTSMSPRAKAAAQ